MLVRECLKLLHHLTHKLVLHFQLLELQLMLQGQGFSISTLPPSWAGNSLWLFCASLSSTSGLYPLDPSSSTPHPPSNWDNPNVSRYCKMSLESKIILSEDLLFSDKGPNRVVKKKKAWALESADLDVGPNFTSYLRDTGQVIKHSEPQSPRLGQYCPVGVLRRLNQI